MSPHQQSQELSILINIKTELYHTSWGNKWICFGFFYLKNQGHDAPGGPPPSSYQHTNLEP